jgi:hypothetical protein
MSFLDPAAVAAMLRIQQEDEWMETLKFTGPGLLTRSIYSYLQRGLSMDGDGAYSLSPSSFDSFAPHRIQLLPVEVFSPVPNSVQESVSTATDSLERRDVIKKTFVKDGVTIAVHWWQRSWQASSKLI